MTTGYRVPAAIIEVANRVLRHLNVSVSPARSLRAQGAVVVTRARDIRAGTADAVEKALVGEGLVGVIAPDPLVDDLRSALPMSERVELVAASVAKGAGVRPRGGRGTGRLRLGRVLRDRRPQMAAPPVHRVDACGVGSDGGDDDAPAGGDEGSRDRLRPRGGCRGCA